MIYMENSSIKMIPDDKYREILGFISLFERDEKYLNGLCYWFAFILDTRFHSIHGFITYEQIENHFLFQYYDKVFDVRGDVTTDYEGKVIPWDIYQEEEPLGSSRIIRDCVYKL